MRIQKIGPTIALLLALPLVASGQQTTLDACPFPANSLKAAYRQMFTGGTAVSTTAVGLDASIYAPTNGDPKAVCAVITVNTQSISAWAAGATPTASDGTLYSAVTAFSLGQNNLSTFKMIRAGAINADVAVQFMVPSN